MGISGTGFGNYGNVVAIRVETGQLHCYCHLDSCYVKVGDKVKKGDIIGFQGNTGRVAPAPTPKNPTAGSHLHFEVREKSSPSFGYGTDINPTRHLIDLYAEEEEKRKMKELVESLVKKVDTLEKEVKELKSQLNPEHVIEEWAEAGHKYVTDHGISDGLRPSDFVRRKEVWTMLERDRNK